MRKIAIYRLRAWEAKTGKIRSHWSMKNSLVLGSDRKVDFRLKYLEGLDSRMQFSEQKIYKISSPESIDFPPGRIHQTKHYAFQWSELKVPQTTKEIIFGALLAVAGLLFLAGYTFVSGKGGNCSYEDRLIASGRWKKVSSDMRTLHELILFEAAFHSALKDEDLVKAKLELESARALLQSRKNNKVCQLERSLVKWEEMHSKRLILKALQSKDWLGAANALQQLPPYLQNLREYFEKQVIRSVRDLYFEAYRSEEDDPQAAMELIEELSDICEALGRATDCYRNSQAS